MHKQCKSTRLPAKDWTLPISRRDSKITTVVAIVSVWYKANRCLTVYLLITLTRSKFDDEWDRSWIVPWCLGGHVEILLARQKKKRNLAKGTIPYSEITPTSPCHLLRPLPLPLPPRPYLNTLHQHLIVSLFTPQPTFLRFPDTANSQKLTLLPRGFSYKHVLFGLRLNTFL